jgi:hypothetical protein
MPTSRDRALSRRARTQRATAVDDRPGDPEPAAAKLPTAKPAAAKPAAAKPAAPKPGPAKPPPGEEAAAEQAAGEAEGCPVCRQAWGDHNLPRARACSRSLEEALALAEHRLLSLSDSRKRTPDDVLPIRP